MSPPAPLEVDMVGVTDTSAVPISDPLTVNGVPAWREKMIKMPTGVAAASSSDMFKSPVWYLNVAESRSWISMRGDAFMHRC
jgi:aromatic amino acid aminotransferase I